MELLSWEKVIVNKYELMNEDNYLGSGSEGSVYKYGEDKAIKVLTTGRPHIIKNKLTKINIFLKEKIEGHALSTDIAIDEDQAF